MQLPSSLETAGEKSARKHTSRLFPWLLLSLVIGLVISDYMSRQVISSVYPFLRQEWNLSDAQLATLNSVVALMVGLMAVPVSILADRWGHVKSMVLMAAIWSASTTACALVTSYEQMLGARFLVGMGEAAFGSAGIAVLISVFPRRLHASLSGAFYAAGSIGSVFGVATGGIVATHLGWRWSFAVMAVFGFLLVAAFRLVVTEPRLARHRVEAYAAAELSSEPGDRRPPLRNLFSTTPLLCIYAAAGLQMFTVGVLIAWLPSYFNRYYSLAPDRAGVVAAVVFLAIGTGMVLGGAMTDRASRREPERVWATSIVYCAAAAVLLVAAFGFGHGPMQLALLGVGALFASATSGGIASIVIRLTHPAQRASALGVVTMSNSIFGLALGPVVVGAIADRHGLGVAMQVAPLAYVIALAVLILGKRSLPETGPVVQISAS